MTANGQDWVRISVAAEMLDMTVTTFREKDNKGEFGFKSRRDKRGWREYRKAEIARYVASGKNPYLRKRRGRRYSYPLKPTAGVEMTLTHGTVTLLRRGDEISLVVRDGESERTVPVSTKALGDLKALVEAAASWLD